MAHVGLHGWKHQVGSICMFECKCILDVFDEGIQPYFPVKYGTWVAINPEQLSEHSMLVLSKL